MDNDGVCGRVDVDRPVFRCLEGRSKCLKVVDHIFCFGASTEEVEYALGSFVMRVGYGPSEDQGDCQDEATRTSAVVFKVGPRCTFWYCQGFRRLHGFWQSLQNPVII